MDAPNLEANFKFFYKMAKILILELSDEDKTLAAQWLRKLASCQSPADSELRNHYMTLLLIVLQQKRIVGPFKKSPAAGSQLVPFDQDYQPADIQKLIDEELTKVPPPPLLQFGLSGGPLKTEFSVTQEIPKFGVHFYYVCTMEPVYDFQRNNRSRIPPALLGPTQSTVRDLNAGIESLLRSEKRKLKVTVDPSGRKTVQVRDENFAQFSEQSARPRRMPKRLQQRLGVEVPQPEPEELDGFEEPSPRRPPARPVAPSASTVTVEEAVAAAVGAAVAAAAGAAPKPRGPPKPKAIKKPGIAPGRPQPGAPSRLTLKPPVRQQAAPGTLAPPSPAHTVDARSPLRFSPHPDAPPTPPLFVPGAQTQGLTYQPEQFGLDPSAKFAYPKTKLLSTRWSPSKRGERVQARDVVKQHPISQNVLQVPVDERQRITTPEIEAEIQQNKERAELMANVPFRSREMMRRYYDLRPVPPKAIQFPSPRDPRTPKRGVEHEETFQPILLDDSPVDELMGEDEMIYDDLFGEGQYSSPVRPGLAQRLAPGDVSILPSVSPRRPAARQVWPADEEDLLENEEIDFEDILDSPVGLQRSTPRTPMNASRRLPEKK